MITEIIGYITFTIMIIIGFYIILQEIKNEIDGFD